MGGVGLRGGPRGPARLFARYRNHVDAVHRARCHAEITAGAPVGQHGVHLLGCAGDGIDRAGLYAERAANAARFVDTRHGPRLLHAVLGVQRTRRHAEQGGQPHDALGAARRAAVGRRLAPGHGLGVRAAAVEPTFGALGLRQQGF
ncbi:hypothetical protein D3C86_1447150 [compost metagenome]